MAIPIRRPSVGRPAETVEQRLEKAEQCIADLQQAVKCLTDLTLLAKGENPLPLTEVQRAALRAAARRPQPPPRRTQ
jgi:hypothetical protein